MIYWETRQFEPNGLRSTGLDTFTPDYRDNFTVIEALAKLTTYSLFGLSWQAEIVGNYITIRCRSFLKTDVCEYRGPEEAIELLASFINFCLENRMHVSVRGLGSFVGSRLPLTNDELQKLVAAAPVNTYKEGTADNYAKREELYFEYLGLLWEQPEQIADIEEYLS